MTTSTAPNTIAGSIAEELAKSQAAGRAAFVEACWRSAPLPELVKLASAAGLAPSAADALRGQIANLMQLVPMAETFDARMAAWTAAQRALERDGGKIRAKIEALENELASLAIAVADAERAMAQAETARRNLLSAELDGLKPPSKLTSEYHGKHAEELRLAEVRAKFDRLRGAFNASLDQAERLEQVYEKHKGFGEAHMAEFIVQGVNVKEMPALAAKARENAAAAWAALPAARAECLAEGIAVPDASETDSKRAAANAAVLAAAR